MSDGDEIGSHKVNYNIDPVYIQRYDDVYHSEEYFENMELIDAVRDGVMQFCELHPEFDFIRKLDAEFLKVGDTIDYEGREVKITKIDGHQMSCECGMERLLVPKHAILKNEVRLNKIKNHEITVIYMGTKEALQKAYSDIKFFSTICDYLKLVPSLVWQALPFPERAKLYSELSNSEGNLLRNKIKNW